MSTRKTANKSNKYIVDECFRPLEEFPSGKLPTLKQVLERCLYFKDYRKDSVQRDVSAELFNLWVNYNVYPISAIGIKTKLSSYIEKFYKFVNYDKKKRGQKYETDAGGFIEEANQLFDVHQKDHKKLAEIEKKFLLKMTDEDYKFYEDQKTNRHGFCTSKLVPETTSEAKFKKRVIQESFSSKKARKLDSSEMKASCSFQGLEEESPQVSGEIQKSDAEISESSSISNDSDPDYSGEMSSSEQNVSKWGVAKFRQIINPNFVILHNKVIDDLSTDQYYAYRICWGVITGNIDDDLAFLEVGPMNHSRWLTLACRILRYYVSISKPTKNLKLIAEFIVKVYFPSWFDIKINKYLTDGPKNLFNVIQRINKFPDTNARNICYKVIDNNSYFAHGENILIGMLADEDEEVRRKAVNKVLHLKGLIEDYHGEKDDFVGGTVESDDDNEANVSENDYPSMNKDVRVFLKPKINFKAVCYYKMTSISQWHTIPPVLRLIEEDKILEFIEKPLKLRHECHSQNVERHVKLVTEASASVVGHDRRDGVIRNKIRSRKLLKNFKSKSDFKF